MKTLGLWNCVGFMLGLLRVRFRHSDLGIGGYGFRVEEYRFELQSTLLVLPLVFPMIFRDIIPYITPLRTVDYSSFGSVVLGPRGGAYVIRACMACIRLPAVLPGR